MNPVPSSPRMLLIAPRFFGYEHEIAAIIKSFGYCVDMLPDRPFNNPLMKAVMRFSPELGGHRSCNHFFSQRLEELGRNNYSTILIIQGEGVTAATLMILRDSYPRAQLVFYTWDSIENKPYSRQNLNLYDHCSTFDPLDAKKYGMHFRPLFYTDGFNKQASTAYTYDLSFIGTVHSDRYRIVSSLLKQLPPDAKTFVYLYLQAPWMYDLRRIFTMTVAGANREDFRFEPLSKDFVQSTFLASKIVLDIEHFNQRGATMRTIEALGSKRKMVTTNTSLRDYDFYNPMNIHIVDRKVPILDQEFLQSHYQEVPEKIRQKYSIRQWVLEVCGKLTVIEEPKMS
jgi:hypothetical protein